MHGIEEIVHGSRKFEWDVTVPNTISEHRVDARSAGRRNGSYQQRSIRKPLAKNANERQRCLHFTNGHRVDPDTVVYFRKSEPKALPETIEISTIAEAANKPIAGERHKQQIRQEIVEKAHRSFSSSTIFS